MHLQSPPAPTEAPPPLCWGPTLSKCQIPYRMALSPIPSGWISVLHGRWVPFSTNALTSKVMASSFSNGQICFCCCRELFLLLLKRCMLIPKRIWQQVCYLTVKREKNELCMNIVLNGMTEKYAFSTQKTQSASSVPWPHRGTWLWARTGLRTFTAWVEPSSSTPTALCVMSTTTERDAPCFVDPETTHSVISPAGNVEKSSATQDGRANTAQNVSKKILYITKLLMV